MNPITRKLLGALVPVTLCALTIATPPVSAATTSSQPRAALGAGAGPYSFTGTNVVSSVAHALTSVVDGIFGTWSGTCADPHVAKIDGSPSALFGVASANVAQRLAINSLD